jgi:hypothetical protein
MKMRRSIKKKINQDAIIEEDSVIKEESTQVAITE